MGLGGWLSGWVSARERAGLKRTDVTLSAPHWNELIGSDRSWSCRKRNQSQDTLITEKKPPQS